MTSPVGIVRIWGARALPEGVARYLAHCDSHVVHRLRETPGFTGARILQRDDGAEVELLVVTCWDSAAAVRRFAGEDAEAAVVHPAARASLLRADARARNFQVLRTFGL